MSKLIPQNSTAYVVIFKMVSLSDGKTGIPLLTTAPVISKNGGPLNPPSGAIGEIGSGYYKVSLNATDTATLGSLYLTCPDVGGATIYQDRECDIIPALQTGDAYALLGSPAHTTIAGDIASNATAIGNVAAGVWNVLTSGMTTAGSIGKKFADWVIGQVTGYATNQDPVTLINAGTGRVAKLDNLDGALSSAITNINLNTNTVIAPVVSTALRTTSGGQLSIIMGNAYSGTQLPISPVSTSDFPGNIASYNFFIDLPGITSVPIIPVWDNTNHLVSFNIVLTGGQSSQLIQGSAGYCIYGILNGVTFDVIPDGICIVH